MLHHEALTCRHGGRQKEQGAAVTVAQTASPASTQHPGAGVPLDDKLPAPAGHWAVWYLTPSGEMLQVTDHAPVWGCREGA